MACIRRLLLAFSCLGRLPPIGRLSWSTDVCKTRSANQIHQYFATGLLYGKFKLLSGAEHQARIDSYLLSGNVYDIPPRRNLGNNRSGQCISRINE
jgi:hypothetical protein